MAKESKPKESKDVAVEYKPCKTPTKLSIKRSGWKFTTTWDIPAAAVDKKRSDRWEGQNWRWAVFYYDRTQTQTIWKNVTATQKKSVTIKLGAPKEDKTKRVIRSWQNLNAKSASYSLNSADWYPKKSSRFCLDRVEFFVEGRNKKGLHPNNDKVKPYARFYFKDPPAPSLSVSYSSDTKSAVLTITNTAQDGSVNDIRSETRITMYLQDSKGLRGDNKWVKKTRIGNTETVNSYGKAGTTIKRRYDFDYGGAIPARGLWRRVTWDVQNFGPHGWSAVKTISHVFAQPALAKINSIVPSNKSNPFGATGTVTINLKTNHTETAPVDSVRLQRLRNTELTTATAAGAATGWADVDGATDNRNCLGLTDNVVNAVPDIGKRTWYRLVTKHDDYETYSVPVEAKFWYRKEPDTTAPIKVISCNGGKDGKSIEVKLAWNNDDADGVEISWADSENSWRSTSPPSTFEFTWKDKNSTVSGYANSATVHIRGLTEGEQYFIKARRYAEKNDGSKKYGSYGSPASQYWPTAVTTKESGADLSDVELHIQEPLIRGKDASASWDYQSEKTQTGWRLLRNVTGNAWTVIAKGSDSIPSTLIKAKYIPAAPQPDVRFRLEMTTGGDWVRNSNTIGTNGAITIVDPPKKVTGAGVIQVTKQPIVYEAATKNIENTYEFIVTIRSKGNTLSTPTGQKIQPEGDVIFCRQLTPTKWVSPGKGRLSFSKDLDLIDGGRYEMEIVVIDPETRLTSTPHIITFQVKYVHQAKPPSKKSIIVADQVMKSVKITPLRDSGQNTGRYLEDVCDIYRNTADGPQLVASDVPFGGTAIDKYAPYSKVVPLSYTLVTRTTDGDIESVDIPYNLNGYAIRFDWSGNRTLEVPYNLNFSDAYSKDFEERIQLSGDRIGLWNDGYSRTSSVSTNMVRLTDPEQVLLAKELARYAGPVFVRFPNAAAFMANVDVNNIGQNYDSLVLDVSFSITQVKMTKEFMINDIIKPSGTQRG